MPLQQCKPYSFIKNELDVLLCDDGAFHVFDCTDFLLQLNSLNIGDGAELDFLQVLDGLLILPKVHLCPDKNDWGIWTVMFHFWKPLRKQR